MRHIFCLILIICFLLSACESNSARAISTSVPEPAQATPAAEPSGDASSSVSSRSGYVVPSAPMIPNTPETRDEKASAGRDARNSRDLQSPNYAGVSIVESELDPESNSLIVTLQDAEGILSANLKYIEGLPERYGVQNEGIHQIDNADYYYYFRFYDNANDIEGATIGYYYINGRTGQLFKHEWAGGTDRLRPLTD